MRWREAALKKHLPTILLKIFIASFLSLSGAACKHGPSGPSKLEVEMSSWVGKPMGGMLAAWGAPDTTIKLDDGTSVLTWKRVWYRNEYRHECRKSFTVGADSNIKKWSYNDC
jgi:hypothetical protein